MSPEAEGITEAQEEQLAALLAAVDESLKDRGAVGRPPQVAAEVPAHARRDFERAVACLRLLHEVCPRASQDSATLLTCSVTGPLPVPRQLGRFEVRRELGRGGFGTVYLAHDPQLHREVALKVPHAGVLADPELRLRFQHEGRAAAALHHPNVVAVYEAGESDGVAYIALAYCPGPNLGDWLRQRREPVPCDTAAALLATLAAAIHHAHRQGIVHRDLKPANILLAGIEDRGSRIEDRGSKDARSSILDPQSSIFVPKITDFGLARQLDGGAGHTRTGTILGTPSYMAPEQAGKPQPRCVSTGTTHPETGPAADVYSLGAILYHVLTGRPPFVADTAVETLHQVRFQDPIPPGRLRPGLPRDLETICLKCLEKDPGKRYATALALVEDLDRYRAGKPTRARPVGNLGRAVRWCRRKPGVAGLLAALLVVFLSGFAGVTWQWVRAERMAADLEHENSRVLQERRRAERHLRKTRELLGELTRVRLETARSSRTAGWHHFGLGDYEAGADAYRRAIRLMQGLLADDPDNPEYLRELCLCHNGHAHLFRDTERTARARQSYNQALAVAERLVKRSPGAGSRVLLANVLHNSAVVLQDPQYAAERERRLRRALALTQSAADEFPANNYFQEEKALALEGFGLLLVGKRQQGLAEKSLREALAIRQRLYDHGHGGRHFIRYYLARSHTRLGRLLASSKPSAAETEYRTAVRLLKRQNFLFPAGPYIRLDLAEAQFALADLLAAVPEKWEEVDRLRRQALTHCEQLVLVYSKRPGDTDRLVWRGNQHANDLLDRSCHDAAAKLYLKVLRYRPSDAAANNGLAWILLTHPDPKRRDTSEAVRRARQAVRAAAKVHNFHNTLGVAYYRAGNWKNAVASLRQSLRLGGVNAYNWFFLAMACRRLGEAEQARRWYEKAEQWRKQQQPGNAELRHLRVEARAVLAAKPGP
jgi:tetratricopeptide (TPR) repeat protein